MSEVIKISDVTEQNELIEREGRIERAQRNAYYEIGLDLKAIRDRGLYKNQREIPVSGRYSFTTFEEYVEQRWDMERSRCFKMIQAAEATEQLEMLKICNILPTKESHVRELLKLEEDGQRAEVWQRVVERGETITAAVVQAEVSKFQAEMNVDWITVDEWKASPKAIIKTADKHFNKQEGNSIEWAQWSWNPITGCKHDCSYCYARDIANRFYPQKFEPSIYPARFSAPYKTKVPEQASRDTAYKNVFTGSMADLFGRWVPAEWIKSVFEVVRENPQWNFLFLTKFPKRMVEFDYPINAWLGTSVDCQARVKAAEEAFENVKSGTRWLSVEPMLEPLKFNRLDLFDWIVIGGASRSSGAPAWVPPLDWLVDLHQQAREAGCKIYYKDNLGLPDALRIREFPWEESIERALPNEFKYLASIK